jgi:hypothetical protein
MMTAWKNKIIAALLFSAALLQMPGIARAAVVERGERVTVGLASPVANNSGYRVWGSKYYPGDVLSQKMEEYMLRRLRSSARMSVASVRGSGPDNWAMSLTSPHDVIIRVGLEYMRFRKRDLVGSDTRCEVSMTLSVYDSGRNLLYEGVIENRGARYYPLYNDILEREPLYWDAFERSVCWPVIRAAMDEAIDDAIGGYNGYRVIGRVAARAERVDGSLTVAKGKRDRIYHVTLGREEGVNVGDTLAVTRASSVRTVVPEAREIHFPQVVARMRVIFVKGRDAVAEVVRESRDAPVQLGDAVSLPLYGRRDGAARF